MLSQFPVEREVIIIYFWTKDPDLEQPINLTAGTTIREANMDTV